MGRLDIWTENRMLKMIDFFEHYTAVAVVPVRSGSSADIVLYGLGREGKEPHSVAVGKIGISEQQLKSSGEKYHKLLRYSYPKISNTHERTVFLNHSQKTMILSMCAMVSILGAEAFMPVMSKANDIPADIQIRNSHIYRFSHIPVVSLFKFSESIFNQYGDNKATIGAVSHKDDHPKIEIVTISKKMAKQLKRIDPHDDFTQFWTQSIRPEKVNRSI